MSEAIIVAIITGVVSVIGNLMVNSRHMAIIETKIEMLEKSQTKHNQIIERTYALEKNTSVLEEQIKVANHRIEDLERGQ